MLKRKPASGGRRSDGVWDMCRGDRRALATTAAHGTMLQRSPRYIFRRPARDAKAAWLKRWLPAGLAHRLARMRAIFLSTYLYKISRKKPWL